MKNKGLFKMNSTTMIAAILVAALLLWRHFGSSKVETPSNDNGEGTDVDEDREDKNENPDLNVSVKMGSSGSAVKKCQERANTIILLVRNNMKKMQDANIDQTILQQAMKVSKLTTLKVDGKFGPKTETVVQVITGNKTTSLYTLRKKYANWTKIINSKGENNITAYPWWPF